MWNRTYKIEISNSAVTSFMVDHNMKCDRSADETWEEFEKAVINAESKPETIGTRNFRVVKRVVSEGYGCMLKRTCVDQHKKKTFVFYANDRIAEIKAEEDTNSRERFEQKQAKETMLANVNVAKGKKKIDTEMSKLIKKAKKNICRCRGGISLHFPYRKHLNILDLVIRRLENS